jgi:hypothetical protein
MKMLNATLYAEGKVTSTAMMTPAKRERYAQWLRNTGVEHPSDELIDKTRERALSQIDAAKEKKKQFNLKVFAFIFLFLAIGVYMWLKL